MIEQFPTLRKRLGTENSLGTFGSYSELVRKNLDLFIELFAVDLQKINNKKNTAGLKCRDFDNKINSGLKLVKALDYKSKTLVSTQFRVSFVSSKHNFNVSSHNRNIKGVG